MINIRQLSPLLPQLYVFLVQLGAFLLIDWLDVRHGYHLPISESLLWWIAIPLTWSLYSAVLHHYSRRWLNAIIQGLIQTLVSFLVIVAIMLFFHQWIGGTF
ncbi:hypothetical protein [Psychrobacter pygoscelis]|uniref:hypothetical protein n=1 Tax=Psychrobacter pygoscelis TaxID=2488563 RepID=UPI00103BD261|nr:hypothetical protein [Psychrobacter pygoscelis]